MAGDGVRALAAVTGASRGIGLEIARQFAMHGHDLVVGSRGEGLDSAAAELAREGADVTPCRADLSTHAGVRAFHEAILEDGRPLELLAVNAGVGLGGPFEQSAWEDDLNLLMLNVVGAVHLAKLTVPGMVRMGRGRILFTVSTSATAPVPFEAVYGASKAFLLSFSEAIRDELRDTGVSVTALLPGPTDTGFFHHAGMDGTKVAEGFKDDAAEVARQGFEAMMARKDKVIAGRPANWLKSAVTDGILPDSVKARRHRKMSEPGSGTA